MKKFVLAIALSFIGVWSASAQEGRKFCYSTEKYKEAIQHNPDLVRVEQNLENFTRQYIQQATTERQNNHTVYIIPIVFHIIHNYGNENIPDDVVYDAVRILNIDYRKLNADTSRVIQIFKPLVADAEIEFRLATIDPNGNCTNGIDRIASTRTYVADDNSKLNPWPNNKYLNIWVVYSLANTGAAAYAYRPGLYPSASVDGVIARYDYVGSIGASSPTNSRTLTHEIGHCLNLQHPWGSTNSPGVTCGDDGVSDTPITKGWDHCDTTASAAVCNPPIIENVQNYMDYSYCDCMFTIGQVQRMQAALNSSTAGRNNLWSAGNLAATGTDGSPAPVCAPTVDFMSSSKTICAGTSITFTDLSWNGHPTAWSWTFPGGIPSSSIDSAPTVQYPTPGIYDVSLTTTNLTGSGSLTKTSYIRVSGPAVDTIPFSESFENANSFPGTDGYLINPDNGQTWTRVTVAGSAGTCSIRINNYTNSVGAIDDYVTSSIDFSNVTQPVVTFKYANARRDSTSNDQLKLYGTSNCGKTWTVRWSAGGGSLTTAGIIASSFLPNNASQWRQQSVTLNALALKPNVRLMFENISDRGNNTYIDEINITGNLVSVDEISDLELGFALYPNPTTGATSIQFSLSRNQEVSLEVRDLLGRIVKNVLHENISAGLHEYKVGLSTPGIYLVDLVTNGSHHVRKLIVSEK